MMGSSETPQRPFFYAFKLEDDDDWGGGPAIREYLDGLEEDDTIATAPPKKVSHSDPQARWLKADAVECFRDGARLEYRELNEML